MKAPLRMASMFVYALFALSACAGVPVHGQAPLGADSGRPTRAIVEGSVLGYSDQDLKRVVSSCLAHLSPSDDAAEPDWKTQLYFETSFMGAHAVEEVKATLVSQGKPVASHWTRILSPDDEPESEFCHETAGVVQDLLTSVARKNDARPLGERWAGAIPVRTG